MTLRVLIVEDDPEKLRRVVEFLREKLAAVESEIEHAGDAASGRRALGSKRYDLLVVDLVLPKQLGEYPDLNAGRELVDLLFEIEPELMPHQIIALTGFRERAMIERGWFDEHAISLVEFDTSSNSWARPLEMRLRQTISAVRASESAPKAYSAFIGIVCALDDEFDAVKRLAWPWQELDVASDPAVYLSAQFLDVSGKSRLAIATLCPRMGMSAAAISATKLIQHFRPEFLAMPGITAGLRGKVEIGDVIAVEECWDWGMGKYERRAGELVFSPSPQH